MLNMDKILFTTTVVLIAGLAIHTFSGLFGGEQPSGHLEHFKKDGWFGRQPLDGKLVQMIMVQQSYHDIFHHLILINRKNFAQRFVGYSAFPSEYIRYGIARFTESSGECSLR